MKLTLKLYASFLTMAYLHNVHGLSYRNNNGQFTVGVLSGANFYYASLYLYWEVHKKEIKNWRTSNSDWLYKLKPHYQITMGEELETLNGV